MEACGGTLLSDLRPRLDDAAQQVVDAQVARHVASINALGAPAFGRPEPTAAHHAKWSTAFEELVGEHLADARDADVELPLPPDELENLVKNQAHHLDVITDPRVVHWDLYDTNVFVDPESLDVVGLLEFERVLWADPIDGSSVLGQA